MDKLKIVKMFVVCVVVSSVVGGCASVKVLASEADKIEERFEIAEKYGVRD